MKQLLKKAIILVYALVPCKRAVCNLLRHTHLAQHALVKNFWFRGTFEVKTTSFSFQLINYKNAIIERMVFWRGLTEWEKEEIDLWIHFTRFSHVIVDIGANTGIYSVLAAKNHPSARVVAFEPSATIYKKLQANVALNSLPVTCEPCALSNTEGQFPFYEPKHLHHTCASLNPEIFSQTRYQGNKNVTQVATLPLDVYIERHRLEAIDLVKIDVELHEMEVLEGFARRIFTMRPVIFIEVLNDDMARKLGQFFDPHNYRYYPIAENCAPVAAIDAKLASNYLLLPSEKQHLLTNFNPS